MKFQNIFTLWWLITATFELTLSILDLYMCTYIVHLLVQCPLYWSSQFSLGYHGDEIFSPERKIRKQWKSVTDDEFCNWIYKTICKKFIRFMVHGWVMSYVINSTSWLHFTDLPDFGVGGSYAVPDMVSLYTCWLGGR